MDIGDIMDTLLKSQAFKLKGRLYTLTVLQLLTEDIHFFKKQLEEVSSKAPRFFASTPVILDLNALKEEFDLEAFCQALKETHCIPFAVQATNANLLDLARAQGMAILNASSTQDKILAEEQEESNEAESIKTKLQTTPVRSGQQVVSKGGDLIITASVSHGAELLADGNIHVYGALRGRALAGISGDKHARIFCHSLEAELVSIAGFYRLSDGIGVQNGPCQIYLQEEHICIEPLC